MLVVDQQPRRLVAHEQGKHADVPGVGVALGPLVPIALTDAARLGKVDPVVGRDEEIRRIIQVLCRRTKNNPVLIGEPGVGRRNGLKKVAQCVTTMDEVLGTCGESD